MIRIFTTFLTALIWICSAQSQSIIETSKISAELNKSKTLHSTDSWQIASIKGDNKTQLLIEAVKYKSFNSANTLKGIKITLLPDNTQTLSNIKLSRFIDYNNYAEIMVITNNMLTDYKKKIAIQNYGSLMYSTLNGIKFGFIYTEQTQLAYISFIDDINIYCEVKEIDVFLKNFLNYINIASKDLYLPENANRINKVKKSSNQEVKDATIDDI